MMSNKKSSRLSAMKALYIIPLVGISLAATAETKVDYLYDEPQAQSDTTSLKVIQSIGYSKEDGENSWRKKNAMELIITPDQNAKTVTVKYLNDKLEPEEKVFTDIDFSNDVWICNSGVITKDIADKLLKQENIVYASRYLDNGKKVNVIVLPSLEVRVVRLEGQDPKPLVVVDGIPMEKDFKLESINPDEIKNIAVLKDGDAVAKYGTAAKDGVIEVEMKNPQAAEIPVANGAAKIRIRATDDNVSEAMPLIVINGKTMEKDFDLNSIDPKNIESMNVLKDKASIEKYGEAAKNGVVEINLKKE